MLKETSRPLRDLLLDACQFTKEAFATPDSEPKLRSRFARAATLASVASLECCSNLCLDSLQLPAALNNDLDKLPFLTKFDLFVRLKAPGSFLARGLVEVEKVQELKVLRDHLVHPRGVLYPVEELPNRIQSLVVPETPKLKMSRSSERWGGKQCLAALAAVDGFLTLVLLKAAAMAPGEACRILLSELHQPPTHGQPSVFTMPDDPLFDYARLTWKLRFEYLCLKPLPPSSKRPRRAV